MDHSFNVFRSEPEVIREQLASGAGLYVKGLIPIARDSLTGLGAALELLYAGPSNELLLLPWSRLTVYNLCECLSAVAFGCRG